LLRESRERGSETLAPPIRRGFDDPLKRNQIPLGGMKGDTRQPAERLRGCSFESRAVAVREALPNWEMRQDTSSSAVKFVYFDSPDEGRMNVPMIAVRLYHDSVDPTIPQQHYVFSKRKRAAPDTGSGGVAGQIDGVARSGLYTALPQAQMISSIGTSLHPTLSIENRAVELPSGNYRIMGRVAAPCVLPFPGDQDYAIGAAYREIFHLE
jgi:hypothetical protein